MTTPRLSMVVLTWNEEANIGACLASLAHQTARDFEVVVVDAASTDRTVEIVQAAAAAFPVPLRLVVADRRIPIGEARNRGVRLARAPIVAFLSADAEAAPDWVEQALRSMANHDMAFSQQLHAPPRWTLGAAVRGLRYHFPRTVPTDPLPYASNVAAAYSKDVLVSFPFDPWANAAEDLLLAQRAHEAGFLAVYNPRMVVRHHDVATVRQEMRKNVREGQGCGLYVAELGVQQQVLLWGGLLVTTLALVPLAPVTASTLFVLSLWAPALRRAVRRRKAMPVSALAKAVGASPAFDLAFLVNYVRGLATRRPRGDGPPPPNEVHV